MAAEKAVFSSDPNEAAVRVLLTKPVETLKWISVCSENVGCREGCELGWLDGRLDGCEVGEPVGVEGWLVG